MPALVIEDAREYIFPLFLVETEGDGIILESREFLGTAFFVSKQGDAVTASHIVLKPDSLPANKRVVAIVQRGNETQVCWITHFAADEKYDFALIHVNLENTKYLSLNDRDVRSGSDVQLLGIPSHEVWLDGKEMRLLKGHITLISKHLELNIAIPRGMSGSPVFIGTQVIAFAIGSVKGEEIEDYTEEVELISNHREQIRITKVTQVTHYGLALPFSIFRDEISPIFENKTLIQFINARNS